MRSRKFTQLSDENNFVAMLQNTDVFHDCPIRLVFFFPLMGITFLTETKPVPTVRVPEEIGGESRLS